MGSDVSTEDWSWRHTGSTWAVISPLHLQSGMSFAGVGGGRPSLPSFLAPIPLKCGEGSLM